MSGHTPEPWTIREAYSNGEPVGLVVCSGAEPLFDVPDALERDAANAARIVACVNACAGIPTEALEAGALATAIVALKELQAMRFTCEQAALSDLHKVNPTEAWKHADAALAKLASPK